jgi:hypothetical protein
LLADKQKSKPLTEVLFLWGGIYGKYGLCSNAEGVTGEKGRYSKGTAN